MQRIGPVCLLISVMHPRQEVQRGRSERRFGRGRLSVLDASPLFLIGMRGVNSNGPDHITIQKIFFLYI